MLELLQNILTFYFQTLIPEILHDKMYDENMSVRHCIRLKAYLIYAMNYLEENVYYTKLFINHFVYQQLSRVHLHTLMKTSKNNTN